MHLVEVTVNLVRIGQQDLKTPPPHRPPPFPIPMPMCVGSVVVPKLIGQVDTPHVFVIEVYDIQSQKLDVGIRILSGVPYLSLFTYPFDFRARSEE